MASSNPPASHTKSKPLALIIIDGFGYSSESQYNAIVKANSPTWDRLWQEQPSTVIHTSGMEVGLPAGQMGNSEVGHMTLGAGRVVYQNFTRINKSIEEGDFFQNPAFVDSIDQAINTDKAVHIFGLLSPGGVHSHENHIFAMIRMAAERGAKKLYLHAFLDGRDMPPRSALPSLEKAQQVFSEVGVGHIASMIGRFYALDRDNRWDRVQAAYDLMCHGTADFVYDDAAEALEAAYQRDENDEFVKPTRFSQGANIEDGDSVIFMNFRPDRAREITHAFVDKEFKGFRSSRPKIGSFVMTTEYSADIKTPCAYPPEELKNSLGEFVANQGMSQLRIAETEKYAHVTFFFSGGQEDTYKNEDRILIPSPDVTTYDQQPEMSAVEVTDKLVEAIESDKYDIIVCNYANCDQVGHTGNFDASVKAVESVDQCIRRVCESLAKVGGEALITADHGNVEIMFDDSTGQPMTQHTTLPVPLVYVGPKELKLLDNGSLADIAPTMLFLLGLKQPADMNGRNLVELQ